MYQRPLHDEETKDEGTNTEVEPGSSPLFSTEKEALFRIRFEENYDLDDPEYIAWLKIVHPEVNVSISISDSSSSVTASSVAKSSATDLSDVLVLPAAEAKPNSGKKKAALTSHAVCITDDEILTKLKCDEEETEKKKIMKQKEKIVERGKEEEREKQRRPSRRRKRRSSQKLLM